MPETFAWVCLCVYGAITWTNGYVGLLDQRKRRRERAKAMTCELFGHSEETVLYDKAGNQISFYCPKCDSNVERT